MTTTTRPAQPYQTTTAHGVPVMLHPGICGICWQTRHPNTPHHPFEPASLPVWLARQYGWC